MLRALHTIKSYPLDLRHPIFSCYPAMKYGERQAIQSYANLLAPLAEKMIAKARGRHCILLSPPVRNLPSSANLLCEELYRILCQKPEVQAHIDLKQLRLIDKAEPFQTDADFRAYGDYARLDYNTRCQVQHDEEGLEYDRQALEGREVIFVNDINVTGSQLRWIRSVLRKAKPRAVHALLIVNTVSHIGRRFPHLESEINGSRLSHPDELASLLRKPHVRYTGKLVARLLALGAAGLDRVLREIDHATRCAMVQAMFDDGSYADDFLRKKLASLQYAADTRLAA